ncbi:DivIVA domain-containing protein [Streptosporangium sp. NPDC023615]|uniref:DivIVA domain-containing protein n=1 Tax=Streptosporangium sp. NPDC023615 TaxID=3154794 RepID=UPI003443CDD5
MDLLIRRIEGTLGRGSLEGEPITADEIRDARFRTKLGGYNEVAVDFALEAFIVAIETRQTSRAARVSPAAQTVQDAQGPVRVERHEGPVGRVPVGRGTGPVGPVEREPGGWYPEPSQREPARWPQKPVGHDPEQEGWSPEPGGYPGSAAPREPVGYAEPGAYAEPGGYAEPVGHPDAVEHPGDEKPPEVTGPGDAEEHAARIERAAFRPGRLGMGYREEEVDAFLDRVVATLRGTTDRPLSADDVREARFATVMLRPGYAVAEVDEFLADLAGVMDNHIGR